MTSVKENRYDRQLRLWGDIGQQFLEQANICLIGANAVGCEILKNLILPGIGSFVLLDDKLVTPEDLGNNFFLTSENLMKNRAQAVLPNLLELNEEVTGSVVSESLQNLLTQNPEFFRSFDIVVVTEASSSHLISLSKFLFDLNIPLLTCLGIGIWGLLHLSQREHCIVESHPDYIKPDLRLDIPFLDLLQFIDSQKLDEMDFKTHSHTPWLVILLQCVNQFRKENNGKFPTTYEEKKKIKSCITAGMREPDIHMGLAEEENFTEAIAAVNSALIQTIIPNNIQQIINSSQCNEALLGKTTDVFWILVAALKRFIEKYGHLPLSGSLPDMTSDSERYIQLQKIYQSEADKELQLIQSELDDLLSMTNLRENVLISDLTLKTFCKNAAHLHVIKNSSFHHIWTEILSELMDSLSQPSVLENHGLGEQSGVVCSDNVSCWFMALRAAFELHSECCHWPGNSVEDSLWMRRWCIKWLPSNPFTGTGNSSPTSSNLQALWDCIEEICRCSPGGLLHPVAALLGGVAAQEVIKVITKQYVPINGPIVYNAMQHDIQKLNLSFS